MGRKKKEYVECALFVPLAIVLVMVAIYIPLVTSGYHSLMEWNGISKKPVFIGLKNFAQMFAGLSDFVRSLVFTSEYTVLSMLFTNVLATAAAVVLVQKIKVVNVMRSMFFIPYIVLRNVSHQGIYGQARPLQFADTQHGKL